jgi:hypothetical protein
MLARSALSGEMQKYTHDDQMTKTNTIVIMAYSVIHIAHMNKDKLCGYDLDSHSKSDVAN